MEVLQKFFRMLCFPIRLVLVQDDLGFPVPACPVEPHIALALGLFAFLMQHLKGRFVRMENGML